MIRDWPSVVFADVEDLHDAGVLQVGDGTGLALQASPLL
jgi:hypothetical protein